MGLCPKPQFLLESQLKVGDKIGFNRFRVISHAHFHYLKYLKMKGKIS